MNARTKTYENEKTGSVVTFVQTGSVITMTNSMGTRVVSADEAFWQAQNYNSESGRREGWRVVRPS